MQKLWCRLSWAQQVSLVAGCWLIVVLGGSAWFSQGEVLPFTPSYPYSEKVETSGLPRLIRRLGGFDGVHYDTIVRAGYHTAAGMPAFFPLYPLLVKVLSGGGWLSPILVGVVVSVVCGWAGLLLAFRLVSQKWGEARAWWVLGTLLCSPVSFFLVGFYTESLFLLLLLVTIWCCQRRWYGGVAVAGMLLSATRVIGVLLPVCLVGDYLWRHLGKRKKNRETFCWRELLLIGAGGLGLAAYTAYLGVTFGDPLAFLTAQQIWGRQSNFILLPQVFWRYGKMIYYGLTPSWGSYATIQELVLSVLALAGLGWGSWQNFQASRKHQAPVYPYWLLIFSWLAYLIPPLTGKFDSMPRYLLSVVVVYPILASLLEKNSKIGYLLLAIGGCIMALNLLLFVQGFWVA